MFKLVSVGSNDEDVSMQHISCRIKEEIRMMTKRKIKYTTTPLKQAFFVSNSRFCNLFVYLLDLICLF